MCDLTRRRQASICGCPTSATAKSSLPPDVIFRPAIWAPPTHQARHPQRRGLWACKAPVVLPLRPLFARSFARWAVGPSDIGCVDRSNASHRKPRDLRLDQIDPYCYTQVGKKKAWQWEMVSWSHVPNTNTWLSTSMVTSRGAECF